MPTKILVIGATGTVGSEVMRQLMDKDVKIRASCHTYSKCDTYQGKDVELVEFDFNDMNSMQKAIDGIDKIFLVTPSTEEMPEITKNIAKLAKKMGVKHMVKLSVMGAGENASVELAKLHTESEKAIEATGMSYTFVRPSFFMQNYVNFYLSNIKENDTIMLPSGSGKVPVIDVKDIATVAVKALTESGHEGKKYEITGPRALENTEVAEILSKKLGRKIEFKDLTEDEAREGMKRMGMPDKNIDMMLELYGLVRNNMLKNTTETFKEITGKEPRNFEDFADENLDLFS